MKANGVVASKLVALDRVLAELRSLGTVTPERLAREFMVQRTIERDLQVAVQIMVDICQRILSLSGHSPVATATEAIEGCVRLNVLPTPEPFRQMAQFRNIVVHLYDVVDPTVLCQIVNEHLGDFESFRDHVLRYVSEN